VYRAISVEYCIQRDLGDALERRKRLCMIGGFFGGWGVGRGSVDTASLLG